VSRSIEVLNWRQFRAMPLYLQFVLALMVVYAAAMTVLSVLIAADGRAEAGVTLSIAAFVLVFAFVAVPTLLGGRYAGPDEGS
jgi:hypothetical protein